MPEEFFDGNTPNGTILDNARSALNFRFRYLRTADAFRFRLNTTDLSRGADLYGWPLVPDIALAIDPDPGVIAGSPGKLWEWNATSQIPEPKVPDRHGWIKVATQSRNVYNSLRGDSLYTYKRDDNETDTHRIVGSYNYKTAYLNIGCGLPVERKYADFPDKMANGTTLPVSKNVIMNMVMNDVDANASKDAWGHPLRNFELWVRWTNGTVWKDGGIADPGSMRSTCNITTTHVEVSVSCGQLGCVPVRMRYRRPSQAESPSMFRLYSRTSAYHATSYSTPFDSKTYADIFFSDFILFDRPPEDDEETVFGSVIRHGLLALDTRAATSPCSSWCVQPVDLMRGYVSRGLSFWANTYAQVGQYEFVHGYKLDPQALAKTGSDGKFNSVTLNGAFYKRAYYVYWPWIAADFASCLVLLVAGVLCHWLRVHTLAPDIFGYVSSLTRDNPYFDLPNNGSALSGLDRARLMKKVKVKIGDMNAGKESEVGKIGVARLDAGGRQVVGLTKGKVYM